MSRYVAKGAQIAADLFSLSVAYWLAFLFRFELALSGQTLKLFFFTWPYVIVLQYLTLALFDVPSMAWRYVGLRDMRRFVVPLGISTSVLLVLRLGLGQASGHARYVVIPLGVIAMDFILAFLLVTGTRVLRRIWAEREERAQHARRSSSAVVEKRTLLIGAGRAGVLVAKSVQQNPDLGIEVVGFLDDDPMKSGAMIQGVKVLGNTDAIGSVKEKLGIQDAVITIASASGADIRRIVAACKATNLDVKIIPGISEILGGKVSLSRIRKVTIADLLGREAVELDNAAIADFLKDKRVLVTGAGGSIGAELCRQVHRFGPSRLVLLDQAENGLFDIHEELAGLDAEAVLVPCVADICDKERIAAVFREHRPEVVFHAAAHKHVPLMEWNPGEAIKNNVFGTQVVADLAHAERAAAFVLISTDKAVNPTSIMGATKRMAELYIQGISKSSSTKFVGVRFGNVLGSAGSVIPIFQKQIASGGPVTVTHPEMKRYFMTIPEACQLVMQAASMGEGGEIFVLDMGEPVRILDLARDLIRLSGFSEDEISIEMTGIRPGEKLFEELCPSSEQMTKTRHPKIFIGKIASLPLDQVTALVDDLIVGASASRTRIREILARGVPEMQRPDGESDSSGATADAEVH